MSSIGGYYEGIYRGGLVEVTDRHCKDANGLFLVTDGEQARFESGDKVSFRLVQNSFGVYIAADVMRR